MAVMVLSPKVAKGVAGEGLSSALVRLGRSRCIVCGREFGDRTVLWEELYRLSNTFGMRGWDIDAVAPVVLA